MEAGKLRHQVQVERPRQVANAMGEMVKTWEFTALAWADIRPVRGRDLSGSEHPIEAYDVVITMRPPANLRLDITHRLVAMATAQVYDIVAVVNVEERNRMLEVRCLQGASLG